MMEEEEEGVGRGSEGPTTPRATPTNVPPSVKMQQEEALKR
jgi:hypothetical protein